MKRPKLKDMKQLEQLKHINPTKQIKAVVGWRKYVRWGYVLPRVAVIATIFAGVRFGLDPLLHYSIVASGEAALGSKVDVGSLTTSILDGRIVVDGFAATNPQKPMRNLTAADRVQLDVDMAALLKRRFVIKNGLVRGVQFDTERATSGALEPVAQDVEVGPSMFDPLTGAASEAAVEWFDGLSGRLQEDLESKLATLRVANELEDRWKQQYASLKSRADELRAQAKQIERDFAEVKKNPLRGIQEFEKLKNQLTSTQADLKKTLAEIQALPAQTKNDRAAIDAARKQDQKFLKASLNVAKTDGRQLTDYLLGDLAHGYVAQGVSWVNYLRTWIPKSKIERPARAHGTNVLFVDHRQSKCLIERVVLTGRARVDGQPLEVTALLTDAATEPQFHERPLQMHFSASGALGGEMLVTLDRRHATSLDTITLDCPHVLLADRTLGNADKLAVNVGGGEASITADIKLIGDELSGTIHIRQASQLTMNTAAIRDDRIGGMLAESLRGVDRLEATVELGGTMRKPSWKIDSNLGPQLADGVNSAVRKYLAGRRDAALAKVQGKVDEQLAKLEAMRTEAQQELLGKLGEDQQMMTQLASIMGGNGSLGGLNVPQIGSALNLDKLKR
jgi:uncharacterized protein (TIGR03545 family)